MITGFLEMLTQTVFDLLSKILGVLPAMPFDLSVLEAFKQSKLVITVLSWINYFVPVSTCLAILTTWSVAMMTYIGFKMAIKYSKGI